MARDWIIVLATLSVTLASFEAGAVSLGDARVRSAMMQPLHAEITVGLDGLEAPEDLRLSLAPQEVLERFGIPYDHLLPQLRFRLHRRQDGPWVVVVTTRDPVREPYFSFAVNASWPHGQIVREYSLLLDPPELRRPSRTVARSTTRSPETAPPPATDDTGGEYGPVRPGETLWPIAQRLKPAGVSTRKMMVALLRANPQAFGDGNINNLLAGASLRVPTAVEIDAFTEQEARAEVARQMASWNQRAAPPPPPTPVVAARETPAAAAPEPTAKPEPTPAEPPKSPTPPQPEAAEEGERLQIVSDAGDDSEPLRKEILLTLEQVEADRLRSEALRDRVEKLEAEMEYLQRLLVLKERQIATLQQITVTNTALNQTQNPVTPVSTEQNPAPATAAGAAQSVPAPTGPSPVSEARAAPGPGPASTDFERQLLIYAVVALTVIVALLAMLLFKRGRDNRAGDYTLGDHPDVREPGEAPYADQIRQGTRAAQDPAPRRTVPPVPRAESALSIPPPPPRPTATPPRTAPPGSGDAISDDDLASWARDLDEDVDLGLPPRHENVTPRPEPDTPRDPQRAGADSDDDLDIPSLILDIDTELQQPVTAADSGMLELAQAYLEIGDLDGARELLEKLVADGDKAGDVAKAKALLAEIQTQ